MRLHIKKRFDQSARFLAILLALSGSLQVLADEDVKVGLSAERPMLTLDPGMHTAPIRRIAVDSSQTLLVTASDDKSARIWEIKSGRLLATLHPPAGSDQIGRLYGVAISPNNQIALGGTTAPANGKHRIYLFDLASHAFITAVDARGGNIKRLEWSPDGKFLAAVYADSPALRVFDTQGRMVYEERYTGDTYYLCFSRESRMAVSVTDGKIHLYSLSDGKVVPDGVQTASMSDPRGVQFSPDGRFLAVGYFAGPDDDTIRVDVFNTKTRELARAFSFSPNTLQGNLMNVAWKSDGSALYAAGTGYQGSNRFIVKRITWPAGKITDIRAASDSIYDLISLRDGRILFSTAEPSWGLIEGDHVGKTISAPTAHFYQASALKLNKDASEISWPPRPGESPVHFNLAKRELGSGEGAATRRAVGSNRQVQVTEWENFFSPTIGGRDIKLGATEASRASAVLPDNSAVILGSSRSLRKFSPDGTPIWTIPVATEVRSIGVSEDGKVVVCAMFDSTIRWRRVDDGSLLMSLFVTRDGKWVIWTEQGYFDVGAGAESLVGWLVNRPDVEQADFYNLSRFREKYYRPDIIDRILLEMDVSKAIASANAARLAQAAKEEGPTRERVEELITPQPVTASLPPSITLISPASIESETAQVTIDYKLFSSGGEPITSFEVRVDGRPYDAFTYQLPATSRGDTTGRLTLTLPEKDGVVQFFVGNTRGISAPAEVKFKLRASRMATTEAADRRPALYLLAVGVSAYADAQYNLEFAAKDATDFMQIFMKQNGQFYRRVDARLLTDERATRTGVLDGLAWLKKVTANGDVGVLYVAGHGINDVDDTYYFLPHDVDLAHLSRTAVAEDVFRDTLTNMKGKSLFFVDTCNAGKAIGVFSNQDLTRIANKFSSPEYGVIVFSAANGHQGSQESEEWNNGAFTKALVTGLEGGADYRREGVVTHRGLDYYVGGMVTKMTNGLQTPVTTVPTGLADFGLAKVLPFDTRATK